VNRCFILGDSPSLDTLVFQDLRKGTTIGVNKTGLRYPVDSTYTQYGDLYKHIESPGKSDKKRSKLFSAWQRYSGQTYALESPSNSFKFADQANVIPRYLKKEIRTDLVKGIYPGHSSAFGALMLACALGFKEIYLLGFGSKQIKSSWHDTLRRNSTVSKDISFWGEDFTEFKDSFNKKDIKVYSLSDSQLFGDYPRISFKNAIR